MRGVTRTGVTRGGVIRIGVISDTHGLLRPEAVAALQGVDHILHAGDVGDPAILATLAAIAPLTAIRGNVDRLQTDRPQTDRPQTDRPQTDRPGAGRPGACAALPATEIVELGGVSIYMLHALADLDLDPAAAGFGVVVSGHTHQPAIEWRNGVLYFNPGSAGPRRFSLPVSLGILQIAAASVVPRHITLISVP
jgi:putative phosphoesterase